MIEIIKEIKNLSLEDCITYENLIKERIKELGGGKLTEMLNILRPYYGDNKMILCQTYKDDEAPYDIHKLSFYECDDDYFNSIPYECNEVIDFFDNYCENHYHDCKDLYPGEGMVTYIDMDGNITYEKINENDTENTKKDISEILDILRLYCVDNKMILCEVFKSFDAPYDLCEVSFDDCDNDFIYSLPSKLCDEVIEFFEDYCRKFYADEDGLYPGGRIITYIDMDGNITYKKR